MTELVRYNNVMDHPRTGHFIDFEGDEVYRNNYEYHREDGPAIICANGTQIWVRYGEHHREDGPATIHPDGKVEWRYDGHAYSFEEFVSRANWTEDQIIEWKLTHEYEI